MQKPVKFSRSGIITAITFMVIAVLIVPIRAQQIESQKNISQALQNFDTMVRQSRLQMPKFCKLVQELMKMQSVDKEKQTAALKHIQMVKSSWEAVQRKFQDNPPLEYQQDKNFKGRLAAIHSSMQNMENRLLEGKFKESFLACANTCGLFVRMHEENHLVYALDKLFHLRKITKMITRQSDGKQASAVRQQIGKMLDLRNQVFLAPCPAAKDEMRCKNYQQSLQTLSAQLDGLAIAVTKNKVAAISQKINALALSIQKTYMLAL